MVAAAGADGAALMVPREAQRRNVTFHRASAEIFDSVAAASYSPQTSGTPELPRTTRTTAVDESRHFSKNVIIRRGDLRRAEGRELTFLLELRETNGSNLTNGPRSSDRSLILSLLEKLIFTLVCFSRRSNSLLRVVIRSIEFFAAQQ